MNLGSLIFISSGNSIRSQIAEGFAREFSPEAIQIFSAGVDRADPTNPTAIEVMKEFGIDISRQQSKRVIDLNGYQFDLAVNLDGLENEKNGLMGGAPASINWNIAPFDLDTDDAETLKDRIRQCAMTLRHRVQDLFESGYFEALLNQHDRLNSVLNSVSDVIIGHDLKRKIFFFSDGASQLTGLQRSDVIGKDCNVIFKPRLCGENCSFCTPGALLDFENKRYTSVFYDPEGNRKELDVNVIPLRNTRGALNGVIAAITDVTELTSMKQRLGKQTSFRGIIGKTPEMIQVFQQITDLGAYDYPVHIHGETGVGKELVAKAIHEESARSNGPFVPINCGALPEGLVESELFGHVKGSFSGAIRNKKGRFELADGGTIFLDEVADLPKSVQVKLLRFLQEGTLEKVGSETQISVNVRVISATNKDLLQETKKDHFREDLYYRLNVIPISLPPLRKCKGDIELLCDHFLKQAVPDNGSGKLSISDKALSIMMAYHWPGNVRELENAIRFSVVRSRGQQILPQHLPMELQKNGKPELQRGPEKKLDKQPVLEALKKAGGNKAKAARILGVGRATLYRFLNQHPEISVE